MSDRVVLCLPVAWGRGHLICHRLKGMRFRVPDNHLRPWQILNRKAVRERILVIGGPGGDIGPG